MRSRHQEDCIDRRLDLHLRPWQESVYSCYRDFHRSLRRSGKPWDDAGFVRHVLASFEAKMPEERRANHFLYELANPMMKEIEAAESRKLRMPWYSPERYAESTGGHVLVPIEELRGEHADSYLDASDRYTLHDQVMGYLNRTLSRGEFAAQRGNVEMVVDLARANAGASRLERVINYYGRNDGHGRLPDLLKLAFGRGNVRANDDQRFGELRAAAVSRSAELWRIDQEQLRRGKKGD